jgi:hypothetical protein
VISLVIGRRGRIAGPAVSVDADCVDAAGNVIWEKVKPAHFCGRPYDGGFVAAYEKMDVGIPYDGPEALRFME